MKEALNFYKNKFFAKIVQLLYSLNIIKSWESKKTTTDSTTVTFVNDKPHKGGIPYKWY